MMTEQDLLQKIKDSAREVEVPEQLSPEQIQKGLEMGRKPRRYPWKTLGVIAAVLACAVCLAAVIRINRIGPDKGISEAIPEESGIAQITESESTEESVPETSPEKEEKSRKDAGDMFVVAQNYDQVYALLDQNRIIKTNNFEEGRYESEMATEEYKASDDMGAAADESGGQQNYFSGHSQTNVQTQGVDESDIIKTDGSYLYTVRQNQVAIVDIQGDSMKLVSSIELEDAGTRLMEMYVQGDTLNLIVQKDDVELGASKSRGVVIEDVFYMDANVRTQVLTYDISDRRKPELKGDISQDGVYETSRKIGTILYLFTNKYDLEEIPEVNGEKIAADSIYLPERGYQSLVVSSVDVRQPNQVLDQVMIVNDYVQVYVSTDNLYLYQYSWQNENISTRIAKFSLDNGVIDAVGATSVKGEIYDTFAIQEKDGQLRVLTTDWSGEENSNHLYVLDEDLHLLGSLQGLAEGEQIYAARFLGDMAYFVTYRNTDPLFAVDLSDPKHPTVLAELKITGFSEYLHFWGEDKLLGIGYETDPQNGNIEGIKLTMFDISDPSDLKVQDTVVCRNLEYAPALYEYKTVLADARANLFGFAAQEKWSLGGKPYYYLYSWNGESFELLLEEKLSKESREERNLRTCRGLYSKDRFYLADPTSVTSYDRTKGYEKVDSLSY